MKTIFFYIIFTLLVSTGFSQTSVLQQKAVPEEYGYIVKIGQQMPEIEFTLTNGQKIMTSDLKGKVVMLQFTASWCSVCRSEMPHIENEIWQKHKNSGDFLLYGIDLDEPLKKVNKFHSDMKITYPLALDPKGKIFYTIAEKGAGVTRNIILDRDGKIVFMTRLYKEEEFNEMKNVIESLLSSDKNSDFNLN